MTAKGLTFIPCCGAVAGLLVSERVFQAAVASSGVAAARKLEDTDLAQAASPLHSGVLDGVPAAPGKARMRMKE